MATNVISDLAISEALKEIVVSADSESIFYKYKSKKEIGEKIFADLYTTFDVKGSKELGFRMTDSSKDFGVLSQCQSLQALLLLASEFGLDFDTAYLKDGTGMTIREIMDTVIENILDDKKFDKETGNYIFDASPYETDLFDAEYANIDAIRWIIPTFLLVLQYHATIKEICKWEDKLVSVISYGLKYINDSFIGDLDAVGTSNTSKLIYGWNFTKDCEEPSLYYTFAVCECLLGIYRTFDDHLTYQKALRTERESGGLIPVPDELKEKHALMIEDYNKRVDMPDPGYVDEENKIRKRARFGRDYELVRIYKRINDELEAIDGTLYGGLERRCKAVAGEIWRLVKDDFADSFFYNDLETKVSQDDIRTSTTSDVLFNSVYIINSVINAGVDEDLLIKQKIALANGDNDLAEEYLREYNELLETCQLASQRALRSYESLKKEGKEYIVDQFLVGFNENFVKHRERIRELRKLRMRVFSLLPMLIRTNNIIGEYLVRYPQATMSKYLGYILENRRVDRKKTSWIWESDGFFSASNYYYVAALGQFYSYYETYEESYIEIAEDNDEAIDKIREQYKAELENDGIIHELNKTIEDKNEEIAQLKAEKDAKINALETELANQHNPIEDAVRNVVRETLEKQLPELFCAFVEAAAKNLAGYTYDKMGKKKFSIETSPNKEGYQQALALQKAFDDFFVATVSGTVYNEIDREKDVEVQYTAARKNILAENRRCLGAYAAQIIIDKDMHRSELFKDN